MMSCQVLLFTVFWDVIADVQAWLPEPHCYCSDFLHRNGFSSHSFYCKIAENSTDYSINNTARHVLWLPVDSASKFHGKPAIDTLYVRAGDGFSALTVLIGVNVFALSTTQFFMFNIFLVVFWLYFARMLIKERALLVDQNKNLT